MTEEIIYADINVLEDASPACQPSSLKHHDLRGFARRHGFVLWIALAGDVILATAVIALGVQVFQGRSLQTDTGAVSSVPESSGVAQRHSPGRECNRSLDDLVSRLKQSLCHSAQSPSADGSSCKLCPMDWLSRRGKCYWFSKDSKNWTESRADCSAKSSRKLVLQDQEEMEFIQNVTQGKYYVWLGLSVPSAEKDWTWVDNSVLDQTLFPVTSPTDVNSCGVIKGNRIHSETCSAEFKWICQKEAVLL
ncbi:killer cell lectin-like receptor subfamily F member 1 isoform X1 [Mauremys reevesii]|uniref:killer cell lectin-like receptor subfamily F member 1 isoform X1 n=1 Tax=Mauremys reevesii TaxID=260615 RepID=UPI00193FD7AE|nr:killer cell lectin-like receptor subfamily F member 1 isoform X1 [Mauremys reevesii]XP_039373247.1 killer cell lectin-like receptor subfamily F member 1 isoform X1 [Mauremys reevesii]